MLTLKKATRLVMLLFGLVLPAVHGAFQSRSEKALPSKQHVPDNPFSKKDCQIQQYNKAASNPETLHVKKLAPGHIVLDHYQLHTMIVSNCQIDKSTPPAIYGRAHKNALPNYFEPSPLVKELRAEHERITKGSSSARIILQKMKSTKFPELYLLLATLLCHKAIRKVHSLICKPSKKTSQQDDQTSGGPELTSCAATQMSGETTKDQANTAQELPSQSSNESKKGRSGQHSRGTDDGNQGNEQGDQHQGNAQQPNGDDGDGPNDDQDLQDKQQDDDDESDGSNEEEEEEEEDLQQHQEGTDPAEWLRLLNEPLNVKGITVRYPAPREKRFTLHHNKEGLSSSTGFDSVGPLLSKKAETRFKKAYEKKCKQQQDERINSREDPVSTKPYQINLLDRKFYYNEDGSENLYDGPEEIAAKLGLEYKGSPIVTVYPSSTTVVDRNQS